jgi:hypothetical protein
VSVNAEIIDLDSDENSTNSIGEYLTSELFWENEKAFY